MIPKGEEREVGCSPWQCAAWAHMTQLQVGKLLSLRVSGKVGLEGESPVRKRKNKNKREGFSTQDE